jgi:hypothetical protein
MRLTTARCSWRFPEYWINYSTDWNLTADRSAITQNLALQRIILPDGTIVTFGDETDISLEGDGGTAATAKARKELRVS